MRLNENNSMPYMNSLATCLHKMVMEGYTEDFRITEQGLESLHKHSNYKPNQIEIINFFRFEGESDPDDNAILYVIETNDGVKGILIDAYGVYNSSKISQFLRNVEIMKKKNIKN